MGGLYMGGLLGGNGGYGGYGGCRITSDSLGQNGFGLLGPGRYHPKIPQRARNFFPPHGFFLVNRDTGLT